MPVLILKFKGKYGNATQQLRLTRNFLNLDKITLVGYSVHLDMTAEEDLNAGKVNQIPHSLFITIDALKCQELNLGLPSYKVDSNNQPVYHLINKLILPVSNESSTIQFGCHMDFELCSALHRDLTIKVEHYDNDDEIVDAFLTKNADGQVGIAEITLFFDYSDPKNKVERRNYLLR